MYFNLCFTGVCDAVDPVGEPRVRGSLRVDQDVHHPDVLCQGMGGRIPPTGSTGTLSACRS